MASVSLVVSLEVEGERWKGQNPIVTYFNVCTVFAPISDRGPEFLMVYCTQTGRIHNAPQLYFAEAITSRIPNHAAQTGPNNAAPQL